MQLSLTAYLKPRIVEKRIESFIEEYRPKFVYVFFSGGKDSSAVLAAAASCCMDRVVAVFNHIVGQTHSLNVKAVNAVARRLGFEVRRLAPGSPENLRLTLLREPPRPGELLYLVVRTFRYGLDFWTGVAERWGFPAPTERWGQGVRWCCGEFKEKWWSVLPYNGVYEGRPAKYQVVGVKRSDSRFRARRWSKGLVNVYRRLSLDVALAPLADMSDADVWSILRHYGIYDIVAEQYRVMGHSPNCTLCPLMSLDSLRKTVANLPTPYLERVYSILSSLRERYREGSFSRDKIDRWLEVIGEELGRRRAHSG